MVIKREVKRAERTALTTLHCSLNSQVLGHTPMTLNPLIYSSDTIMKTNAQQWELSVGLPEFDANNLRSVALYVGSLQQTISPRSVRSGLLRSNMQEEMTTV